MPEALEKYEEEAMSQANNEDANSPSSEKEFAPISDNTSQGKTNTCPKLENLSLKHTRSNNGYGVDSGEESNDDRVSVDAEAVASREKDPFEVHWDGGDSDPMNVRSLKKARKWIIVLIISVSSICV